MKLTISFLIALFFIGLSQAAIARNRVIVFDIDDTLVDTSARTLEALHAVGTEQQVEALVRLEISQVDYYCSKTCENVGIVDKSLINRICGDFKAGTLESSWWGQKFFSPDYLKYDRVISGAPEFLTRLRTEVEVPIIFLTGRNERSRAASLAQLKYFGLWGNDSRLLMKNNNSADVAFKRDTVRALKDEGQEIVAAFDDNPTNANMFREELMPTIPVVRPVLDLKNPGKVLENISLITTYYYNVRVEADKKRTLTLNRVQLDEILSRIKRAD